MESELRYFRVIRNTVGFSPSHQMSIEATTLLTYPNIHFRNVNVTKFVDGTLAEDWFKKDRIFETKYFKNNLSNFLRLLVLYKFGGIYLDLDVVVQKRIDQLPSNFVTDEFLYNKFIIQNSVIGLTHDGIGHWMADLCLK